MPDQDATFSKILVTATMLLGPRALKRAACVMNDADTVLASASGVPIAQGAA